MKKLALLALLVGILLARPNTAEAHVFVSDSTQSKGAILHVMPDDDPIAGQVSSLYFDVQNVSLKEGDVELTITGNNTKSTIPVKTTGSLSTAEFTFPVQGAYQIVYTVDANNQTYTFTQAQRVSRGVTGSALDKPDFAWASVLLLASGLGLLVLLIIGFNRRKDIAKQSVL